MVLFKAYGDRINEKKMGIISSLSSPCLALMFHYLEPMMPDILIPYAHLHILQPVTFLTILLNSCQCCYHAVHTPSRCLQDLSGKCPLRTNLHFQCMFRKPCIPALLDLLTLEI